MIPNLYHSEHIDYDNDFAFDPVGWTVDGSVPPRPTRRGEHAPRGYGYTYTYDIGGEEQ